MLRRVLPIVAALIVALPSLLRAQAAWRNDTHNATRENLWSVAFSGSSLVAVGERGTILYSDYEGAGWQTRPSGVDLWLVGVGFGQNRWIAVGDAGTILVSDDDGETWQPRASGTPLRLNAVVHGNGRWLAVGERGVVLTSTDRGDTWTVRPVEHTGFLRALAFGRNQFVFGGAAGALFTTTDGAAFARVAIETTADIEAAVVTPERIFLAGSHGLRAATPNLAAPWQIATSDSEGTIRGLIARSESDASVITDRGTFHYNGGNWSGTSLRPWFLVTAIAGGRNEAVAVGFGGGIARASALENVAILPGGNIRVGYGTDLTLRAVATGTATNLGFQWLHNNTDIPGATAAELALRHARPAMNGRYSVRASTGSATVRAADATLVVVPAGKPAVGDPQFNFTLPSAPSTIVFQSDGRLLVRGAYGGTPGNTQAQWLRLHPDGRVDESFRADPSVVGERILPLPDGRLYAHRATTAPGWPNLDVIRLRSDGSLDPTFAPDRSVAATGLHALPDGRIYVSRDRGIHRLLPDGRPDPTFAPITDPQLSFIAVDAAGRLLLSKPEPFPGYLWVYPATAYRFLPDGSRDAGFSANLTNRQIHAVVGDTLYGIVRSYGRFGASSQYFRANSPAGAAPYTAPPMTGYPDFATFKFIFRPDGGVWDFRLENRAWVVRSYDPNGALDPSSWLELPDNAAHTPLAVAPDGALYVRRDPLYSGGTGSLAGPPLLRLRPSFGPIGRLTNLSVRTHVAAAESPLIAGFVTAGTGETRALLRAIGPGLARFDVGDPMPDPQLTLVVEQQTRATNADWPGTLAPRFTALGAFPLTSGSRDAALETSIGPGAHSALVTPAPGSGPGTTLIELYESVAAAETPRRFVNLSARGRIAPGRPLIAGFAVLGDVPIRLLIRAVGPTLSAFDVPDPLGNPKLALFRGEVALYENDDWSALNETLTSSNAGSGAFPLPANSLDSAMLVTLAPGSYTAVVEAVPEQALGTALVEIYELPR